MAGYPVECIVFGGQTDGVCYWSPRDFPNLVFIIQPSEHYAGYYRLVDFFHVYNELADLSDLPSYKDRLETGLDWVESLDLPILKPYYSICEYERMQDVVDVYNRAGVDNVTYQFADENEISFTTVIYKGEYMEIAERLQELGIYEPTLEDILALMDREDYLNEEFDILEEEVNVLRTEVYGE